MISFSTAEESAHGVSNGATMIEGLLKTQASVVNEVI